MFNGHSYHATIRKIVAVFGTLFNNISIVRKDSAGAVINITRVPLAYGPKQKFLARLAEQPDLHSAKIAIKLPRMSFEIISMVYDTTTKINRNNLLTFVDPASTGSTKKTVRTYAPYRIGFQLSVIANNQDDALQVVEQILPHFQPEYTVTVKELDALELKTDVPFVLTGIQLSDNYEGDFKTRRALVYTLDFETRIRFYGPITNSNLIRTIQIDFRDFTNQTPLERVETVLDPLNAQPDDEYDSITTISPFTNTDSFYLTVAAGAGTYTLKEMVTGNNSGATAKVISFTNNIALVHHTDVSFRVGDTLTGSTSATARVITAITPTYAH